MQTGVEHIKTDDGNKAALLLKTPLQLLTNWFAKKIYQNNETEIHLID